MLAVRGAADGQGRQSLSYKAVLQSTSGDGHWIQIQTRDKLVSTEYDQQDGSVLTIDAGVAEELQIVELTINVTSWVFTNLPITGYRDIEVMIIQDDSFAKTCVSPATSGFTAGGAWTVSAVAGSRELLKIRLFADGDVHLFPQGVMG